MSKKIVIVGGVAGGASTAARLRRLDESAQIIILEKGPYISFANCGLPYHIGDVIRDRKDLILQTPEEMGKRFNLDIRTLNEALRIHRKEKQVEIVDHRTGRTYMESYDVLVLSPGSSPLKPPIEGIDSEGIFSLWTIPDMDGIIRYIKEKNVRSAIVVGGGFIGIEVAENLHAKGIKVTIAEMLDQVMAPLDYDMAQILHRHITGKGVDLILGDGVKNFSRKDGKLTVTFKSGRQETADMAILSIGVSPNGRLASESGLETNPRGGIVTGPDMKTSDESIYAVGDAAEVTDFITGDRTMVPLAGPANKQGRICADNICGLGQEYKGTQGSCVVKVFDLTSATTGQNEKNLDRLGKELNRDYKVTILHPNSHAGYYPGALSMTLKLVFSLDGKVLGAQAVGYEGVDKRMDVIATVIRMNGTVEDLKELELCYAPPYSSAKDPVNMAGYSAENILKGVVDNILVREMETLEQGTYAILDVRTPEEYLMGHIEGALNIPLDDLRDRLHEVPAEKLLIVHCAVGFRSYLACRILLQNGFNQVRNLAGGYTTYSIQSCAHASAADRFTDRGEPEKSDNRINACGLQCPGPIMRLHKELKGLRAGETVEISVTDPGFASDICSWCDKTGNTLLSSREDKGVFTAMVMKGSTGGKPTCGDVDLKDNKSMVMFSGDLDKALAGFIIANGALAMGKKVTMFFTFWGLNILRKPKKVRTRKTLLEALFGIMMPRGAGKLGLSKMNMGGLGTGMMKHIMRRKNVNTLQELIQSAIEAGATLVACTMSMDIMGIRKEELIDGIQYAGVATFLGEAEDSNMTLFI